MNDSDVSSYIENKFCIKDFVLTRIKQKLESENRNYASFKIGVPDYKYNEFLNSTSWPAGVLVKEFVIYHRNKNFLVPRSALKIIPTQN